MTQSIPSEQEFMLMLEASGPSAILDAIAPLPNNFDASWLLLHVLHKGHPELFDPLTRFAYDPDDFKHACRLAAELGNLDLVDRIAEEAQRRFGSWQVEGFADRHPFMHDVCHSLCHGAVRQNNAPLLGYIITQYNVPNDAPVQNSLLVLAADRGHQEVIDVLMEYCEPNIKNGQALNSAISSGHLGVVDFLLLHTETKTRVQDGLNIAVLDAPNQMEMVTKLLPHYSPQQVGEAMAQASRLGQKSSSKKSNVRELIALLYPHADINVALEALNDHQDAKDDLHAFHAEQLNKNITNVVNASMSSVKKRIKKSNPQPDGDAPTRARKIKI